MRTTILSKTEKSFLLIEITQFSPTWRRGKNVLFPWAKNIFPFRWRSRMGKHSGQKNSFFWTFKRKIIFSTSGPAGGTKRFSALYKTAVIMKKNLRQYLNLDFKNWPFSSPFSNVIIWKFRCWIVYSMFHVSFVPTVRLHQICSFLCFRRLWVELAVGPYIKASIFLTNFNLVTRFINSVRIFNSVPFRTFLNGTKSIVYVGLCLLFVLAYICCWSQLWRNGLFYGGRQYINPYMES